MTETPAGDSLVDNSQVFIRGSSFSGTGTAMLGPLDALAGIAADRSKNASAIESVKGKLAIKFDRTLQESLERASAQAAFAGKVQLQALDAPAALLLLPHAVFEVQANQQALLILQVASRFTGSDNARKRKSYFYVTANVRPFAGGPESWTDNANAQLNQLKRVAFDRLAEVILKDVSGRYQTSIAANKARQVTWRVTSNGPTTTGLLLEELNGYNVVMLVSAGKPVTEVVYLIEASLVKTEPV